MGGNQTQPETLTLDQIRATLKAAGIDRRSGWPGYVQAKALFDDGGLSCQGFEQAMTNIVRLLRLQGGRTAYGLTAPFRA